MLIPRWVIKRNIRINKLILSGSICYPFIFSHSKGLPQGGPLFLFIWAKTINWNPTLFIKCEGRNYERGCKDYTHKG